MSLYNEHMTEDATITHINLPIEFVNQLTHANDVASTLECIAFWLPEVIQADRASICLDTGDGQNLQVYALSGSEAIPLDTPVPIDGTMVGRVFSQQSVEVAHNLKNMQESDCVQLVAGGLETCMDAPLLKGQVCFGTINIARLYADSYKTNDELLLQCLANWVANHLFSNHQLSIEKRLAATDPLTGISNRRSLFHVGNSVMTQWQLNQQPFSLIVIDIDHFKMINDKHGHDAGDQVLKEVCRLISKHVRDDDEFGRLGGEEFTIILKETNKEIVQQLAHRLKQAMADAEFFYGEQALNITVSIGISRVNSDDNHFEDVLKRADKAMYQSKAQGRNRITIS